MATKYGYILKRNEATAYSDIVVENFFKSGFEKNDLKKSFIC
jgi:hypothetical protein